MTHPTLGQRDRGGAMRIDVERLDVSDPAWPRFRSKFTALDSGCWEWQESFYSVGYARFSLGGRWILAHRWAYEAVRGAVPEGLDLDHVCRNRWCVNPWHLEPVTRRENLLRGETIPASNARKTHCPKGHLYSEENTRWFRNGRYCKECNRIRNREAARLRRKRARESQ